MARELGTETKNVAGAITSMGIDDLISNLAGGIADGQAALDEKCMNLAVQMGDAQIEFGKIAGTDEPDLISLIELGFTPNFYQFVDTILEVRVSVSSQYEEEQDTTETQIDQQIDEKAKQEAYASQSRSSRSGYGYGYSGGYSVGWGWRGYGVGWGGSGYGYGYSGSNASQARRNSAEKSKSVKVNTVDAAFSSKYAYSVEGSSLIKTKIVPVPPPQVFEEAVRNKAQERKEWAKRFALLRFSKSLLPSLGDSSVKIAESIVPYKASVDDQGEDVFPDNTPEYNATNDIANSLTGLIEEYAKLGNDHWSVIENVDDRRLLDGIGDRLNDGTTNILSYYVKDSEDESNKIFDENANKEAFFKKMATIHEDLTKFKAKTDEIMERLPLTPEEEAAQQTETDTSDNA